jgi:predicted metal-dependent peptidase
MRKIDFEKLDLASKNFYLAKQYIENHPMFTGLMWHTNIIRNEDYIHSYKEYAAIDNSGNIFINPKQKAEVETWVYILAHCLMYLAFEQFKEKNYPKLWNIACNIYNVKFLEDFKIGKSPILEKSIILDLANKTEEEFYEMLLCQELDYKLFDNSAGSSLVNMLSNKATKQRFIRDVKWKKLFVEGLHRAVEKAVNVASGQQKVLSSEHLSSIVWRSKNWFINSYPLLGALAASFKFIEDSDLCKRMEIAIAAVNPQLKEIYINPHFKLSYEECKFVIAHELLHVGLRHDIRCKGRDKFLWNIACDYVINSWLIEMQIGAIMPGALHDPELKGKSAEEIYDTITTDLRRLRKLSTFRGAGKNDIIYSEEAKDFGNKNGIDLDSFYRECLSQGLVYHHERQRGFLPVGLVEEINALSQPPIPWDVELARWFDAYFTPLEKIRSYTRPSRRQATQNDIPRPRYVNYIDQENSRTFGVVLDTSMSMDRTLLAKALGSIAAYSMARDVKALRLIFCDAAYYDQGYVAPEELLQKVQIKGRGGTLLQPAINLIQEADDFPTDAPILIITDGDCDNLIIKRAHAILLPSYGRLPFTSQGQLFRIE